MSETKTKVIAGEAFQVTAPYAEGHVLTAIEAKVLNQVRAENIGNNLRDAVKEAITKRDSGDAEAMTALAELVTKYDAEYTFSTPGAGGGSRKLDPVEREAKSLAEAYIREDLKKKGRTWKQVPDGLTEEEWIEKRDAQVEKLMVNETILKLAKERVNKKAKAAESIEIDGL